MERVCLGKDVLIHVRDMRAQCELEERRKKEKAVHMKKILDTMIATVLKNKGKDALKWKVGEFCVVVKHLKRPGNQNIPLL